MKKQPITNAVEKMVQKAEKRIETIDKNAEEFNKRLQVESAMKELDEKIELYGKNHPNGNEEHLALVNEMKCSDDWMINPDDCSFYENMLYARECVENLKKYTQPGAANYRFVKSMLSVLDYADGEYVNHCEEVGRVAIENIDEIINDEKKEWMEKSVEWLKDCLPDVEYITNASAFRQNKKRFIESYKKYMEEEK